MITSDMQLDKQKKLLIAIICLFMLYADFAYLLKAQLGGLNSTTQKISRLKEDIEALKGELAKMGSLKNKQALAKQKVGLQAMRIVPEGQLSSFLQEISEAANRNGIKIVQMLPARDQSGQKTAAGMDKFTPFLISLEMLGDYHALGKFINGLENGSVFLLVQELKISSYPADYLKQKVSLVLKTYAAK